ncbi:ABC transporter ATP-binding protein [Actinoallomurus sp. CA-150999]|uniref:ABC transporter ATP-binding protein n=1 Tax=Actinoallomurus sp. CA-150999 TaxID=3239887 RepID=UPI003D93C293
MSSGPVGPLVTVRGVHRRFGSGPTAVHALRDVSFDVAAGTMVVLVGRSGSGKTTLLNVIGGLDRPDAGTVLVDGTDVTALDEDGLSRLRRKKVAYVFQTFGLIPVLTAAENVGAPLRLARVPSRERERRVELLLELVGLADHAQQRPGELSGGQQQRVAIARALAASPRLLIADEPTGQLDAETGLSVMALLRGVVESEGVTAVVSTHDPVMIALADRVIRINDGQLDEQVEGQPDGKAEGQIDGRLNGQAQAQLEARDEGQPDRQAQGQSEGQVEGRLDGQGAS